MNHTRPTRANVIVLKQMLDLTPRGMIHAGEIVLFDKAYVDFDHLFDLDWRGVWWVTRAKDHLKLRVVKNHTTGHANILNVVRDRIELGG